MLLNYTVFSLPLAGLHSCICSDPCEQLGVLSEEKESLLNLWEVRRQQYEQCMDLQLFYRDTEQVDNWMSKQEVRRRGAACGLTVCVSRTDLCAPVCAASGFPAE